MRKDRIYAIELRKQGKSYNEINRILNVPKSTLSYWFKDLALPEKLVERLYSRMRSAGTMALVARNKRQTIVARERAEQIQRAAAEDVGKLSKRELFLVGTALYWAEGGKSKRGSGGRRVEFSNSDPAVITTMMRFFRAVCSVPEHKFRIHLTIHSNADERKARIFWSRLTGIPLSQFTRTFIGASKASKNKRPLNRLPHGTIQIRISDVNLFNKIMGWITGFVKQIGSRQ